MTPQAERPALTVDSVHVAAGGTTILDDVSFTVGPRRIVAIVGPNGAGKTTLLDVISGELRPQHGSVAFGEDEVDRSHRARRRVVGRVFQGSPLPATLTAGEIATLATGSRVAAAELLQRFALTAHECSFVSELSTGMRRILDLAVATAARPEVLLLDEPASGLAQSEIEHLGSLVRSWRDETGSCVLLVEHDASLVRAIADEVLLLERGRVVAFGSVGEVLDLPSKSPPRIQYPTDDRFLTALAAIGTARVRPPKL